MIRRRTRCVYCGRRIPGAVTATELNTQEGRKPWFRLAARFTCSRHRRLPLNDPAFDHELSRA